MRKEREILEDMVAAKGNTAKLLPLLDEATELVNGERDSKYYRHELMVGLTASLRTATAIETLLKEFDERYPEVKQSQNDEVNDAAMGYSLGA